MCMTGVHEVLIASDKMQVSQADKTVQKRADKNRTDDGSEMTLPVSRDLNVSMEVNIRC